MLLHLYPTTRLLASILYRCCVYLRLGILWKRLLQHQALIAPRAAITTTAMPHHHGIRSQSTPHRMEKIDFLATPSTTRLLKHAALLIHAPKKMFHPPLSRSPLSPAPRPPSRSLSCFKTFEIPPCRARFCRARLVLALPGAWP